MNGDELPVENPYRRDRAQESIQQGVPPVLPTMQEPIGNVLFMEPAKPLAELDWRRLGTHLEARRIELELSAAQLADRAGVSEKVIYNYEGGRVPSGRYPRLLPRVIRALGWAAGSDHDILNGGEPTLRAQVATNLSDDDSDMLYILRHLNEAGARTKRAMRAVLEVDVEEIESSGSDEQQDA